MSPSRPSKIVKQVCGYGDLEVRAEVLTGDRNVKVISIEEKFKSMG